MVIVNRKYPFSLKHSLEPAKLTGPSIYSAQFCRKDKKCRSLNHIMKLVQSVQHGISHCLLTSATFVKKCKNLEFAHFEDTLQTAEPIVKGFSLKQ